MIHLLSNFAAACPGGSFLGFPHWYQYLQCQKVTDSSNQVSYVPQLTSISDVWSIVAAIIEILLRIAGIVAVVLVVYGGIQYITSQGEPDKTAKARSTIINSLVGLAIAILSASLVAFVAGRFN